MKNWLLKLAKRVTLSLAPPPLSVKTGACWISGVSNEAWLSSEAFTNLAPPGTILRLYYLSRGFQHREVIVQVKGPRKPIGPASCGIQLSESAFRTLESPNAGSIQVKVEGIA